jgi:hypothetical protein
MPQNMPKLGTAALVVAVIAAWVYLLVTPAFAGKAFVAPTGRQHLSLKGTMGLFRQA